MLLLDYTLQIVKDVCCTKYSKIKRLAENKENKERGIKPVSGLHGDDDDDLRKGEIIDIQVQIHLYY